MLEFAIHPVYWLLHRVVQNQGLAFDAPAWILLACFGVPVWVFLARLLAELPGTKTGRMHFWWFMFAVFHVWGIIGYFAFDRFAKGFITKMRLARRLELADRTEEEILASPFGTVGSRMTGPFPITGLPTPSPDYKSPLSTEPPSDDQ